MPLSSNISHTLVFTGLVTLAQIRFDVTIGRLHRGMARIISNVSVQAPECGLEPCRGDRLDISEQLRGLLAKWQSRDNTARRDKFFARLAQHAIG